MKGKDLVNFFKDNGFVVSKNGEMYIFKREVCYNEYDILENKITIELDKKNGYKVDINDHITINEKKVLIIVQISPKIKINQKPTVTLDLNDKEKINFQKTEDGDYKYLIILIFLSLFVIFVFSFFVNKMMPFLSKILNTLNKKYFKWYL